MAKVLVVYHSLSGNTEAMAKAVAEGAQSVAGTEVVLKQASEAVAEDLLSSDAVAFGSATHFSYMGGTLKDFFDRIWGDAKDNVADKPCVAFGCQTRTGSKVVEAIEGVCAVYKLRKVAEGAVGTRGAVSDVLDQCRELGKKLAQAASSK